MFTRPVTGVPAARSSQAIATIKVYAILAGLAVAALLGLLATVAWVAFTPEVPDPADTAPSAGPHAEIVARDYLAGRRTAVPVAEELDATFGGASRQVDRDERAPIAYDHVVAADASRHDLQLPDERVSYEQHRFLVADGERLFHLDVVMLLTDDGPVLAAQPSLAAAAGIDQDALPAPLDYHQAGEQLAASEEVREALTVWARAYGADDRDALRSSVGDSDASAEYVGVGGFELADDVAVLRVLPGTEEDTQVVRLQVLFADERRDGARVSAEYDLLVTQASTSLPHVVAWGPAGTTELTPTMNRIGGTAADDS